MIDLNDIETGIYYDLNDLGRPRSEVLVEKMKELNPYNNLIALNDISDNFLKSSTLVLINYKFCDAVKYNEKCRQYNSKMIYLESSGCSGFIFVDGGKNHKVMDLNDENIEPVQIGVVKKWKSLLCKSLFT